MMNNFLSRPKSSIDFIGPVCQVGKKEGKYVTYIYTKLNVVIKPLIINKGIFSSMSSWNITEIIHNM